MASTGGGGGAGGAGPGNANPGAGGSGVVILRHPSTFRTFAAGGNCSVVTSGGFTYYTYFSTGALFT
jgi:hypothetical protein